jgi:hypothetical protein
MDISFRLRNNRGDIKLKVTYEHKDKIETFNITQRQLFLNKAYILGNELLDLYYGKDNNGEITISRTKTEFKAKTELISK